MTTRLLNSGDVIGARYSVIEFVGEGGMQEVYKAKDEKLNRIVALKAPKNRSANKRFQRSAAMSAKVTHPNVAKTLDYIYDATGQYLVEELIAGEDLKTRLDTYFSILDPHLAAHVFHHIVRGVNAVHKVGVFHRDLKPSNIMVSTDPSIHEVKITDFGIAKMAEAEIEQALKDESATMASQTVVGALPYMAPELIQDSTKASLASDIWSISAILHHLLTGVPPYGTGLSAVPNILEAKEPIMPMLLRRKQEFRALGDELWGLLLSCLKLDPDKRPSASDLVDKCGELCYSTEGRFEARVNSYGSQPGSWGTIIAPSSKKKIFFHNTSFYGNKPKEGQQVIAASFPGSPLPRAFPVLPVKTSHDD